MRTINDSTGREVVDLEFDFNSDGSAFISSATYDDDASDVPANELEYLEKTYPEELRTAEQENQTCHSECLYDTWKERDGEA